VFGWFIGLMVVAMGLLALATPAALYAAVAIGGISYGGKEGDTRSLHFYIQNDQFTKTGSGQTDRQRINSKKKPGVLCRAEWDHTADYLRAVGAKELWRALCSECDSGGHGERAQILSSGSPSFAPLHAAANASPACWRARVRC
jgi:hypothetical protein